MLSDLQARANNQESDASVDEIHYLANQIDSASQLTGATAPSAPLPKNWHFGVRPKSYQQRNEMMKNIWRKHQAQEKEKRQKQTILNQKETKLSIFSEVSEFSAGALKFNEVKGKTQFIPLFPDFYCKEY